MTNREKLADLKQRANDIETILTPWKGLTFQEAKQKGFTDSHESLQAELWKLGQKIISLSKKVSELYPKNNT